MCSDNSCKDKLMRNKQREDDDKFQKMKEEHEEEMRINREQNELRRKEQLEYDARHGFLLDNSNDYRSVFHNNVVLKTPKDKTRSKHGNFNLYDDYDETIKYALDDYQWERIKNKSNYKDWYPHDVRIGKDIIFNIL